MLTKSRQHVATFCVCCWCLKNYVLIYNIHQIFNCNNTWAPDIAFSFVKRHKSNICDAICWCFDKKIPTENSKDVFLEVELRFHNYFIVQKINVTAFWHQKFAMQMCWKCIVMHVFPFSSFFPSLSYFDFIF